MFPKVLSLTVLAALACALPARAQHFVALPAGTWATDITPDGEVVVGSTFSGPFPTGGFIWRWRVDPAPTMIPGGYTMVAVSDDGTVAAGTIWDTSVDAEVAAIWTQATGWQSLGWLPTAQSCPSRSNAYDISGDGTTVVGLSWVGCSGRGFRWTAATGMQELQKLGNGDNRCSAISGDGSALGGFAQGSSNRTPAFWSPDTAGTLIDPTKVGEVMGFDETGSLSVGMFIFPAQIHNRAFLRNQSTGIMTNLGSLLATWDSRAEDVSEDGGTVVGFDYLGFAREAWVWTATDGVISVNNRLAALGVTGVPPLHVCRAVSDDGSVVVGGANSPGYLDFGFIAEFPTSNPTFVDLGNGLAGIAGVPNLTATGTLVPAAPTSIVLTQAKPNGSAALVVGFDAGNLPCKQGVLVPQPDVVLAGMPLSATGALSLDFAWPSGLPGALPLYWQMWIEDAAAPAGFSASNALQSTTP